MKIIEIIFWCIFSFCVGLAIIYGVDKEADRQSRISYDKELGRMVYTEKGV